MTDLEALVVAACVFALDINRVAVNDVSYRCCGRFLGPTLGSNRAQLGRQPGRFRASPLAAKRRRSGRGLPRLFPLCPSARPRLSLARREANPNPGLGSEGGSAESPGWAARNGERRA
jgi:hypothetical protein